jgi:hypothetical protein
MDGKVCEVEGLGRLLWRGLAAPPDQELAEAPAHEARVGMKVGEAFLRSEGEKLLQERGRLDTRPSEGGVEGAEDSREGLGLVKLEQPTADLSTAGADSEQVEEMFVLLRRSIHGEQALQGSGIEMLVLHAILLRGVLNEGIIAYLGNVGCSARTKAGRVRETRPASSANS